LTAMVWNRDRETLETAEEDVINGLTLEFVPDPDSKELEEGKVKKAIDDGAIHARVDAGHSLVSLDGLLKPAVYMIYPSQNVIAEAHEVDLVIKVSAASSQLRELRLKAKLKPHNDFRAMLEWFIQYPEGTYPSEYFSLGDLNTYNGALDFIDERVYTLSNVPFTPQLQENHYDPRPIRRAVVLRDDSMPEKVGDFKNIQSLYHELTHVIEDQNGDMRLFSGGHNPERHTYFMQYLSDALKSLADLEKNPAVSEEDAIKDAISSFDQAYFNSDYGPPQSFQWFGVERQTQHFIFNQYSNLHIYDGRASLSDEKKRRIASITRRYYFPGSIRGLFKEKDGFFKDLQWVCVWGRGQLLNLRPEHPRFRFRESRAPEWVGGNQLMLTATYDIECLSTGKTDVLDVEIDAGTYDINNYQYPVVNKFKVTWKATYRLSDCIMGTTSNVTEAFK